MKALLFLTALAAAYYLLPVLLSDFRHCSKCDGKGWVGLGSGYARWCRRCNAGGKRIRNPPPPK